MERGWYVVHTQTGFEDRVQKQIAQRVETGAMGNRLFQVLIPTEEVVEVKHNKKSLRKRKFFPGYVLVDMILDNETYWLIKGVQGVSGFLGDPKPMPLPNEEIQGIIELTTTSAANRPKPAIQFEKGENVRIIEGPFRHFIGIVEDVNETKSKLKVMVTVFDRPTPVELDFLQVEKI